MIRNHCDQHKKLLEIIIISDNTCNIIIVIKIHIVIENIYIIRINIILCIVY